MLKRFRSISSMIMNYFGSGFRGASPRGAPGRHEKTIAGRTSPSPPQSVRRRPTGQKSSLHPTKHQLTQSPDAGPRTLYGRRNPVSNRVNTSVRGAAKLLKILSRVLYLKYDITLSLVIRPLVVWHCRPPV